MATKVIILGEEELSKERELKKIEFVRYHSGHLSKRHFDEGHLREPSTWDNIELVCKAPSPAHYDILFAYDAGRRSQGALYFGHFNDGIV